jgi:hypothetical protein
LLNNVEELCLPTSSYSIQKKITSQLLSLEDVREAVKHLKHNKSRGDDEISAELFQIGSETFEARAA